MKMFTDKPERGAFYHLQEITPAASERNATGTPNAWTPFFVELSASGLTYHGRICAMWSTNSKNGFTQPPVIGERVLVTFNGLGAGEVVGYFVESGFIGVEVKPDKRPDWHIKQNGAEPKNYLVFGAEVRREKGGAS